MDYVTTTVTAKKWGISARNTDIVCVQNRIGGVVKIGKTWLIPKDVEKPNDERIENKQSR